jgi:hypothetical protein
MADKYSKQYRAARSELEQPDFAGIELGRILPTYKGVSKNDRTCWNRTASNVGAVVFGQRGPMRVVSVRSRLPFPANSLLSVMTRSLTLRIPIPEPHRSSVLRAHRAFGC